jgi:serine/threonine-protein kinase
MLTGLFDWVRERSERTPGADEPTAATQAGAPPADMLRREGTDSQGPPPTTSGDVAFETTGAHAPAAAVAALRSNVDERFIERGVLGRGGMGVVLRVFDHNLDREVAMKVIAPARAAMPGEAEAFVVEARVTGQLDHPNVIPVHELGVDPKGRAYFIMRVVDGLTLTQRLLTPEPERPLEERLQEHLLILLKVCDGISFAHARGLVHCDLKPQNVMTGAFGEVYVLDWGIARAKGAPPPAADPDGSLPVIGTPAYMAPEQAHADYAAISERTDVFGLGAILYAILTGGESPYAAPSSEKSLARARFFDLQDPQEIAGGVLPPPIVEIAMKALARDPKDRYASAAELKQAIERFLRGGLAAKVRTFAPGAAIVVEGELGDSAYFITRGRCRAFKTVDGARRVLREMGPGDVFGEIGVILAQARTATVEAIDEVTVQIVGREELAKGLAFHPWLERIVRALTERFRELDARTTARSP